MNYEKENNGLGEMKVWVRESRNKGAKERKEIKCIRVIMN